MQKGEIKRLNEYMKRKYNKVLFYWWVGVWDNNFGVIREEKYNYQTKI
jgi:hypothetical protein